MPYIKQEDRKRFEAALKKLEGGINPKGINTPGELNYVITRLILAYFNNHSDYQHINDILGALEGAKLEFYRRVVSEYETDKLLLNGDVYPKPKDRELKL